MTAEDYLEKIKKKLERSFNLEETHLLGNEPVDLYADFTGEMGRTMLTKVDVIDKYEINEKCYFKHFEYCDEEIINNYFNSLVEEVKNVNTSQYHMSTDIIGVMIFDEFDEKLKNLVKQLKYSKLYKHYFQGFGDANFICVDLKSEKVYSNKIAKKLRKVYSVW